MKGEKELRRLFKHFPELDPSSEEYDRKKDTELGRYIRYLLSISNPHPIHKIII
jgi:hypothetical protein